MLKGITGQVFFALTLIVAVPMALEAQELMRIRASARVVRSVVPETHAAAAARMQQLAETGVSEVLDVKSAVETENRFAHIFTEKLANEVGSSLVGSPAIARTETRAYEPKLRITVAYTAN